MKIYLEPDDLDVRIELIPLIDVIFCILVFFILGAVSFGRTQGLDVDLPTAETAQAQLGDTTIVELDAVGQLKVDRKPVTQAQLIPELAGYIQKNPQGVVVINAEKLVSYGQVAQLFDSFRQAGISRVALGTVKPPTPQPTSTATDLLPDPIQLNPSPDLAPQTLPQTLPQPTDLPSSTLPSGAAPLQQPGVPSAPSNTAPLQTAPSGATPSPAQTR